ncbi:Bromodomain containing protein [Tritrichomonas foetus]|uniref:Bromodomain containing protein n=1 Tax=Tritrichomonas foetus TaxID=1144522 RepID=A0A1J4JZL2_9EUKA|nr:Bromodomain containing protein [Tritrichomonas foetus]|eukprot:OHT02934.1 Bromodomain containing protein [Tritrichomonas foetus]
MEKVIIKKKYHIRSFSKMRPSRSGSVNSTMNQVQAQFCAKITKKISNFTMARFFRQPVDPKRDGAEDYLDKIKKPMDLGTVLQNLHDSKYQSVDQWKNDMNLIWKNAMTYNNQASPLYIIAQDLQETFKKLVETIPKTHTEEWLMRVRKEHNKLQRIIDAKTRTLGHKPTKIILKPPKSQQ